MVRKVIGQRNMLTSSFEKWIPTSLAINREFCQVSTFKLMTVLIVFLTLVKVCLMEGNMPPSLVNK